MAKLLDEEKKIIRKQGDLFYTGRSSYFHFFNSVIDSGDLAKMSKQCSAVPAVLLVVKSHINYAEGISFPSVRTIAAKAGCSQTSVIKSLKILEEEGYVECKKDGKKNYYRAIEKFKLEDIETGEVEEAKFPYVPMLVSQLRDKLLHYIQTRENIGDALQISGNQFNLNLTINQVNADTVETINLGSIENIGVQIEEAGKAQGIAQEAVEQVARQIRRDRAKGDNGGE